MIRYFLSLGSNLGDRREYLTRALAALEKGGVKVLCSSSLYRTQPVGFAGQPWFYNQVVEAETQLEPPDLLALVKKVERDMGRCPGPKNRPRPIDIDILLAGDRTVSTENLAVPHPRMTDRKFVLVPLFEIAPGAVHPTSQKRISRLRDECSDTSVVQKIRSKGARKDHKKRLQP